MNKLAELDLETLNRVKKDALKFDALGMGDTFLDAFDKGLCQITGERDGELVYGTTELGEAALKNSPSKAKPRLTAQQKRNFLRHRGQCVE